MDSPDQNPPNSNDAQPPAPAYDQLLLALGNVKDNAAVLTHIPTIGTLLTELEDARHNGLVIGSEGGLRNLANCISRLHNISRGRSEVEDKLYTLCRKMERVLAKLIKNIQDAPGSAQLSAVFNASKTDSKINQYTEQLGVVLDEYEGIPRPDQGADGITGNVSLEGSDINSEGLFCQGNTDGTYLRAQGSRINTTGTFFSNNRVITGDRPARFATFPPVNVTIPPVNVTIRNPPRRSTWLGDIAGFVFSSIFGTEGENNRAESPISEGSNSSWTGTTTSSSSDSHTSIPRQTQNRRTGRNTYTYSRTTYTSPPRRSTYNGNAHNGHNGNNGNNGHNAHGFTNLTADQAREVQQGFVRSGPNGEFSVDYSGANVVSQGDIGSGYTVMRG